MILAFDYETTKAPTLMPWMPGAYAVSLHIATSDGRKKSWILNHDDEVSQSIRKSLEEIQLIFNECDVAIAHSAKFDLHWNRALGLTLDNARVYCTQIAQYMLDGQANKMGELKLATLAEQYGFPPKLDEVAEYWAAGYDTYQIPQKTLIDYGERDAEIALAIYNAQGELIEAKGLTTIVRMEMAAMRIFQEMEWNGMLVDQEFLAEKEVETTAKLLELDTALCASLGIDNISSNDQLSCGLFGGTYKVDGRVPGKRPGTMKNGKVGVTLKGLGFKPNKDTEGAKAGIYSVNADQISTLTCNTKEQRALKVVLVERATLDQLNKTYYIGLPKHIIDGKVHPSLNQTLTKTGRLSCSKPNIQNQTEAVKSCFLTRF